MKTGNCTRAIRGEKLAFLENCTHAIRLTGGSDE